jgi:hypothetical protein
VSPAPDVRALANRLIAWLQEELGAQQRLRGLLVEEERAIRAADADALSAAALRVEEEVRAGAARERRRGELMRAFGRAFGADPRALSLTSLAERLGAGTREAEAVLHVRGELRQVAAEVARLGRRIASLARYHDKLFTELMGTLLGVEASRSNEGGVLIDARG